MSALGAVTEWSSTAGYVRRRANWPIGAFEPPSGFSTLVMNRRVISIVTSG